MRSVAPVVAVCALWAASAAGAPQESVEPRPIRTVPPATLPTPVTGVPEGALKIQHPSPACFPSETLPLLTASASPAGRFARAYVVFRASDATAPLSWTPMDGDARELRANLPRPLAGTTAVAYAIEAIERGGAKTRTAMRTVPFSAACESPGSSPEGGVTVGLTEPGQGPLPPGFSRADVAWVVLASGSVVTREAALAAAAPARPVPQPQPTQAVASAGGGHHGVSTGVLVAGGVLLAGAGAAVAASGGGKSSSGASGPPATPPPGPTPAALRVTATASPSSGTVPLTVSFTAIASGGTAPYTFSWAFGDGATGAGASVQHVYASARAFTATVTATDAARATAMATAPVTAGSAPAFRFIEVDVNWSGSGNIQATLVSSTGDVAGTNVVHTGCGTTGARLDRWILQGAALTPGTYTPRVTAAACTGEPAVPVTGALTVLTDQGVRCSRFITLSPGETETFSECAVTQ